MGGRKGDTGPSASRTQTPRKKNLRLMSNNCNNVLSPAVLSPTGNHSISLQNKAHRNVAAPRALWFESTGEFPRGKLLRDVVQQDRKMLQ